MLTGASRTDDERAPGNGLADVLGVGNPHHFIAGGQGALPQNSQGRPWNGDYVFCSGDLVEDLTHNFFLETGARNNKLKVYEMVDHPAARALTGHLLVRGGLHQVAYARAVEHLTGADLMKLFPTPRIPTEKSQSQNSTSNEANTSASAASHRTTSGKLPPYSTVHIPRQVRNSRSRTCRIPLARRRTTCRRPNRSYLHRTTNSRKSRRSPNSSANRRACRTNPQASSATNPRICPPPWRGERAAEPEQGGVS
jgi:Mn-containing catalase